MLIIKKKLPGIKSLYRFLVGVGVNKREDHLDDLRGQPLGPQSLERDICPLCNDRGHNRKVFTGPSPGVKYPIHSDITVVSLVDPWTSFGPAVLLQVGCTQGASLFGRGLTLVKSTEAHGDEEELKFIFIKIKTTFCFFSVFAKK